VKFNDYLDVFRKEEEIIAYFGDARLVRRLDCKFELHGGSDRERAEAREWISMFMHEAVLTSQTD